MIVVTSRVIATERPLVPHHGRDDRRQTIDAPYRAEPCWPPSDRSSPTTGAMIAAGAPMPVCAGAMYALTPVDDRHRERDVRRAARR